MGARLVLLAGNANLPLAEGVACALDLRLAERTLERFPDGELHVEIRESVRGDDVYLLQPTSPPVDDHLLELLLLSDACRRAGAARITAVMPYYGYARQDRRGRGREALGARVVADLLRATGFGRVVAVDLHTTAIEGCFGEPPLEHLSAVPLLAQAMQRTLDVDPVVVSPDLGAVKLAQRYAAALDLPIAIVHKARLTGEVVSVKGLVGDVRGRAPLVVDDMISTGGTVEAAVIALVEAGARPEVTVAASHALLVGNAAERLARVGVRRIVASDSVIAREGGSIAMERPSLAPLLAEAIRRLHEERSLADLLFHA